MKIVHVEDEFHPDTGYQLNLLSKYMVAAGHQVTIITAETEKLPKEFVSFFGADDINERDAEFNRRYHVKIVRIPIKGYYSGRVFFSKEVFKAVKAEKPEVVYVHGNDTMTAMEFLLRRKTLKCPMVLDSHMLDMASRNKYKHLFRWFYRLIFTPIIVKCGIPVIRTQDSRYVEDALGIPLSQCPWISTGSDTMLFRPDIESRHLARQKYEIADDTFVIVYAGKLDEGKGGMFLADALCSRFDSKKNLCFVIVGNATGDYGEMVERRFKESENTILRFPTQKYVDLPAFFQMADVVVFPKQCSLSFYDVQACGLPVIFEANEINSKRACCNNALTFESNNLDDFRMTILKVVNMSSEEYSKMSSSAINYIKGAYDYKDICSQYLDIIQKEVDRYRKNKK